MTFPAKDVALAGAAGISSSGILMVAGGNDPTVTVAGAFVGGLWFLFGAIYGYGEAVDA